MKRWWIVLGLVLAACTSDAPVELETPVVEIQPLEATSTAPKADTPLSGKVTPIPPAAGEAYATYPDLPLSDQGPWILYYDVQIIAINQDGTGLTYLDIPQPTLGWNSLVSSPARGFFAYISGDDSYDAPDLELVIIQLPAGEIFDRIPLIEPDWHDKGLPAGYDNKALYLDNVMLAIRDAGSIAWSPDGRYLAYVGATQGPSGDVYVYDTLDRSARVLTTGAGQAAELSWSPGGEWIAHLAIRSFGTGAGWNVDGMWVVDPTGEKLEKVLGGGMYFIRKWLNDQSFIVSVWRADFGLQDFWTVSIPERDKTRFFEAPIMRNAFDTSGSVVALHLEEYGASSYDLTPGLYVQPRYGGTPIEVLAGAEPLSLEYTERHDRFVAGLSDQTIFFTRQGEIDQALSIGGFTDLSPDESWMLIYSDGSDALPGASVYSFDKDLLVALTDEPISAQTWGRDSAGVFLLLENSRQLIYLGIPDGEPVLLAGIDSPYLDRFEWISK